MGAKLGNDLHVLTETKEAITVNMHPSSSHMLKCLPEQLYRIFKKYTNHSLVDPSHRSTWHLLE